jgi:hypothetical protein
MSTYRALRGVCIGPGRHLAAGESTSELDKATAQFLVAIKAVEEVKDEPKKDEPAIESVPANKAFGKKEK